MTQLPYPPSDASAEELRRYLYRLIEQLNAFLRELDARLGG